MTPVKEAEQKLTPGALRAADALYNADLLDVQHRVQIGSPQRIAAIISRETADADLLAALKAIKSLFAGDPKGEYIIARADGKPMSEGDKRIVESRWLDGAEAAIAKAEGK